MSLLDFKLNLGSDPESRLQAAGYSRLPQSEMWFAPSGGIVSTEEALARLKAEEKKAP
jgi:hypothetical protein